MSTVPSFQQRSPEHMKLNWSFTGHLGRLSARPSRVFRGGLKYSLPRTKRVTDQYLIETMQRLGHQYQCKYSPTLPFHDENKSMTEAQRARVFEAAYKNKNRYSRNLYPEQQCAQYHQQFKRALEATKKRFQIALAGAQVMSPEAVVSELDMQKSCGSPWREIFHTKKEFFDSNFVGRPVGFDPWTVISQFDKSLDNENTAFYTFWLDKLKDEIRTNEKVAENKIRTFNCAPIEVVVAMNELCLEMNQFLYMEGEKLTNWSTVGMTKYLGTWDRMIKKHLAIGQCNSFSSDGGQWDSRMSAFLLWAVCEMRCHWGDYSEVSRGRLRMLYRLLISRVVHGEWGDLIWLFIGNPSGSSNTITDNTLGHAFLWNLTWFILREVENQRLRDAGKSIDDQIPPTQSYQDKNFCLSLCGDDSLFTISDRILSWFNATRIMQTMASWGTIQEIESLEPKPANECVYTSNTSELLSDQWLPCPDFDRVLGGAVEAGKAHPSCIGGRMELTDPRWTLLRLYAIRIESWGSSRCRRFFKDLIEQFHKDHKQLFLDTPSEQKVHEGVTWGDVRSVWKSDLELFWLYTGRESGSAGNTTFPFIFDSMETMTKSPLNYAVYRERKKFDSTLGYPGEGPEDVVQRIRKDELERKLFCPQKVVQIEKLDTIFHGARCPRCNARSRSGQHLCPVQSFPVKQGEVQGVNLGFKKFQRDFKNARQMWEHARTSFEPSGSENHRNKLRLKKKRYRQKKKLAANSFGEASNPGPWYSPYDLMLLGLKGEEAQIKYHGNWGGPNYSAGKFTKKGEVPDWNHPSVDQLDESFKKHDYNYTRMNHRDADRLWLAEAQKLPPSLKKQLAQLGFHAKVHASLDSWMPSWNKKKVKDPGDYPWQKVVKFSPKTLVDEMAFQNPVEETVRYGEADNPGPPKKNGKSKKGKKQPVAKKAAKKLVQAVKQELSMRKMRAKQVQPQRRRRGGGSRQVAVRTIPKSITLRSTSTNSYRFKGRVLLNTLNKSEAFDQYATNWFFDNVTVAGNAKLNFLDINPYSLSVLANMLGGDQLPLAVADYFEKWRGNFRFRYVHSCADTTPGSFGFFIDRDPADTDEDFLGSQQLIARMDSHGGRQSQYALDSVFSASGNNLYLRQSANSDIRKVSAGHAFWFNMMDPDALGSIVELGNMYMEYDITLYNQCANERLMFGEWGYAVSGTIGATTVFAPQTSSRKFPYSNLIVPAVNTTHASVGGALQSLILNSNQTTPTSYFLQVQGQVTNGNAVALFFNGNGVDLTSTCVVEDFTSTSTLGTTTFSFVVLVPANLPPDSAVIRIQATVIATGTVSFDVWSLPSTFFSSDWASLPPLNWSSIKSKIRAGEFKQGSQSGLSIEQRIEDMANALKELREDKKQSEFLSVEQDSPVVVPQDEIISDQGVLMRRPCVQLHLAQKVVRVGEAKNPGPKKCLTQNLKPWLLKCQNSDVTVRKTRTDLADQWKGIEDPNGAYVMSNETYFSIVVFLRNSRSPVKDEQMLAFAKAVQAVLDELDDMEAKHD